MPPLVTTGATCTCSFSFPPAVPLILQVQSQTLAKVKNNPIATINEKLQPPAFKQCCSPIRWTVAMQAAGTPPPPCAPNIVWAPGCAMTKINNVPALNMTCTGTCTAGTGVVTFTSTPAMTTDAK